MLGGDNLFDYALDEYIAFAKEKSPAATIGLYDVNFLDDATRFGVVQLEDGGKIKTFEEKPEQPKSTLIANHRADSAARINFQQKSMTQTSVDDMNFTDPSVECFKASLDFRDHSLGNRTV